MIAAYTTVIVGAAVTAGLFIGFAADRLIGRMVRMGG